MNTAGDESLFHYLSALLCMASNDPGMSVSNDALEELERAEGHRFHLAHIIMGEAYMERSRPEHALDKYDAAVNDIYAIPPLGDEKLRIIAQVHTLRAMALCALNRTADLEDALRLALPARDSDDYRKAVDFIVRHNAAQAEDGQNTACKSP